MERETNENIHVGEVGESNRVNARARYQMTHKNVEPEPQDRLRVVCPNNI
jgi:hypothetical protein